MNQGLIVPGPLHHAYILIRIQGGLVVPLAPFPICRTVTSFSGTTTAIFACVCVSVSVCVQSLSREWLFVTP